MRIAERVTVTAPAPAVWERISDPMHWPRDLGRTRCAHVSGTPRTGVGARYWLHLEVGAAEVGSLIEILEYEPEKLLSWATIRGFEQRGHWRLRDHDVGVELTLGVSYQASGGLAALATDELSSIFVGRYLREALSTLALRLESPDGARAVPEMAPPVARGARALGDAARLATSLARAGLARPARPDRYLRSLAALARSGPGTAGRYGAAAALHPDASALIDARGTVTFAQLHQRTSRLASALGERGIGAGAKVAVMCRNHRGFLEVFLATSMLGADRLLLATDLPKPALTELLVREVPQAIICDAEFARRLSAEMPHGECFVAWAEPKDTHGHTTLEELIGEAAPQPRVPLVGYEGRTRTLTADVSETPQDATHPPAPISVVLSILDSIPIQPGENMLVAAPLWHQWSLMCLSVASLQASTLVLQREFDAEATLASIERERASCCVLTTAMLERILELPSKVRRPYNTGSLRTAVVGGAPLAPALATRFMDQYGEILYAAYVTNRAGWVTIASPKDLRRAPGTAGRAPRHTIVRVLDDDGASTFPGQTGRIFLSNRTLGEPRRSEDVEVFDGLVATGERGHLDDHGRLFLEDRGDSATLRPGARGRDRRTQRPG
ncbi:MAG TPA: AMP-binding protein [Solirubrobacteraceae bacterium]|nr:AMP-binding protein [Solirubrobacteraceae bacterium]